MLIHSNIATQHSHHMSFHNPTILRKLGSFIGGIVGDAYGSSYEFKTRDKYTVSRDMEWNVFGLPPGSFTDDGSMMLCLAASLVEKGGFDAVDQMRRYVTWFREGYMSSSGNCFDIGITTARALRDFSISETEWIQNGKREPLNPYTGSVSADSSGNGGIMRLAPVPILYSEDLLKAREMSKLSSKTTHGSVECLEAAALMSDVIVTYINGGEKDVALDENNYGCESVKQLARKVFLSKDRPEIETTGYVIHTLEAALWAFYKTSSFEEGMVLLAGMGCDVDTVCCVYGQIAGAYYGYNEIPDRWKNNLQRMDLICSVATNLCM